jgi:hypothetical protein
MKDYGIAQICSIGHIITSKSNNLEIAQPFCPECGEKVINKCENCITPLKGSYREESQIDPPYWYPPQAYKKPYYCYSCGTPFPWTKRIEDSAFTAIELSTNLNESEKAELKTTIKDLVVEDPKTTISILKFKTYAAKAGTEIAKALKDILVDVVSESVKKSIWP